MQLAAVAQRQTDRLHHETLRHDEGRRRGQRHARHRAVGRVVVAPDDAFAVGQDRVGILRAALRREPAFLDRQVEGAARERDAQAERRRLLGLDVHRVVETRRKQVVVVGDAGAARHQELGQREPGGEAEVVGVHVPRPQGQHRVDPGEELLVDPGRMGAGQRLEHVVVRVDEARDDDVPRRVEDGIDRRCGRGAGRQELDDAAILHDEAAGGVLRQDRQGGLDPLTHGSVFPPQSAIRL